MATVFNVMPASMAENCGRCQCCHCWLDHCGGKLTAMTTFIAANLTLFFFALIAGLMERAHRRYTRPPHVPFGAEPRPGLRLSSACCTTSTATAE